ncbi:GbsR/MarR family transcriptional regulator [Agrococcus sp. SGAir0287]|uniref:GbsR/MarR family transcriptional regulator n=1 Tax=Agrococcus sp. SGAir0287 TaxID=2070347 RepID=UPI0010CD1202|nr:transcriptional regulator [Agrococcus sp. SGAir0287]QCR18096.1 transcriptional regulator [Agrococcus sp. SGAir0287]
MTDAAASAPTASDAPGSDAPASESAAQAPEVVDPRERMPLEIDERMRAFIEDFAYAWGTAGNPRMDGRVLALFMVVDAPLLSSARIAHLLHASAGAVSMATRSLLSIGFIKPVSLPGDRSHYFRVEDDVWGSFLAGERESLRRIESTLAEGLETLAPQGEGPRRRLEYARRYFGWLPGRHREILADWQRYRDEVDREQASTEDEG